MSLRITGKLPSGKHLEELRQSPNYKKNAFQNLSHTPMKPDDISYWKMMREFFKKNKDTLPPAFCALMPISVAEQAFLQAFIAMIAHCRSVILPV